MISNRHPRASQLAIATALTLGGCASYQLHSDGMKAAASGNHEAAIPLLQSASRQEPLNSEYRIDLLKETASYTTELVRRADDARRTSSVV